MKRENWPVTPESGPRPAGPPDECFYCRQPLGHQHAADCVIRVRTVVVRATVEYVVDVPEDWDAAQIEFHRNEGSWCATNGLHEIGRLATRLGEDDSEACGCALASWTYVREATEDDERVCGVSVETAND